MGRQFYVYTQVPADKLVAMHDSRDWSAARFNDANLPIEALAQTGVISTSYNTLQNQRNNAVELESLNSSRAPMVHIISTVTFDKFSKEATVLAALESSGFAAAAKIGTGDMVTHTHDAVIGQDYFHMQSTCKGNLLPSVAAEMNLRNQALAPMQAAEAKTSRRNMPNLLNSETIASMQMCYLQQGVRHPVLEDALRRMAEHGLDTAADAVGFQAKYEEQHSVLQASHPEWGQHQVAYQAVVNTALHYQMHECNADLAQQNVYALIAGEYHDNLEHAAEKDAAVRDQAFAYTQEVLGAHFQANGAFIEQYAKSHFQNAVLMAVGTRVNAEGFSPALVHNAIKTAAKETETAVRQYGDQRSGFGLANIANDAGRAEQDALAHDEVGKRDEISVDD